MTHNELVQAGIRWMIKKYPITVSEINSVGIEPDVMGFKSYESTVIECKASRQDFKKDEKKLYRRMPERGLGDYRYYLAPKGMIQKYELPEKWGLLEFDGTKIRTKKQPEHFEKKYQRAEQTILISIIRRIGQKPVEGCSIKCYTTETKCRAEVVIDCE